MAKSPLMPKATAVWLVDNTSLTFEQIAEFCGLHVLEVKGIADGDVAHGIKGMDPISSGQLTREEIAIGQEDPSHRMKLQESKIKIPPVKSKKGPKYTPVSRRQDRPNAILWLLRNHPELKDSEIIRLVGTTKPTIQSIRDRTHWKSANLQPMDPVTLGLATQTDLDREVQKGARRLERERKKLEKEMAKAGTLMPTAETIAPSAHIEAVKAPEVEPTAESVLGDLAKTTAPSEEEPAPDIDSVFASLKTGNDDKKDGKSDSDKGE